MPRLVAVHDEAGGLVGAVDVDHAADTAVGPSAGLHALLLVGDDADRHAAEPAVAADQRLAVLGLVLVERAVVEDARRAGRGRRTPAAAVGWNEVVARRRRSRRAATSVCDARVVGGQQADQPAQPVEARLVVRLAEVDRAADRRRASPRRRAPRGSTVWPIAAFTSAGPGEVEAAALGHQQLVAQHRQVAAAGDAVAHDGGELRDARGRDDGVVAEDAAEVVLVGEDLVLQRQEDAGANRRGRRAAGGSRMAMRWARSTFLHGHREERAGLHRGVVGDDHAAAGRRRADAGDDAGRGDARPLGIHPVRRPEAEFEK